MSQNIEDQFKELFETVKVSLEELFSKWPKITLNHFLYEFDSEMIRKIVNKDTLETYAVAKIMTVPFKMFGTYKQQTDRIPDTISFNKSIEHTFMSLIRGCIAKSIKTPFVEVHQLDMLGINVSGIFLAIPLNENESHCYKNLEIPLNGEIECFNAAKPEENLTNDESTDKSVIDVNTLNLEPINTDISGLKNAILDIQSKLLTPKMKDILDSAVSSAKSTCIGTWKDFYLPSSDDLILDTFGIASAVSRKLSPVSYDYEDGDIKRFIHKIPVKCMLFKVPCVLVVDHVKTDDNEFVTISEGFIIYTFNKSGEKTLGLKKILHNPDERLKMDFGDIQTLNNVTISRGGCEEYTIDVFEVEVPELSIVEPPKYSRNLYPESIQEDIRNTVSNLKGFILGVFGVEAKVPGNNIRFSKNDEYIVLCEYPENAKVKSVYKLSKEEIFTNAFGIMLKESNVFDRLEIISDPSNRTTPIAKIVGHVVPERRE